MVFNYNIWFFAKKSHAIEHLCILCYRLFQYIEGANLNNSRVSMTVPVLTTLIPGAGPLDSSAYVIYFYLPGKFQSAPPLPLPELNLTPDSWPASCKAVRKFSGFAWDKNVVEEAEKLVKSLSTSQYSTSSTSNVAYSVAQYNSPLRFFGRVNEVWVDVDGCEDAKVAAYWISMNQRLGLLSFLMSQLVFGTCKL